MRPIQLSCRGVCGLLFSVGLVSSFLTCGCGKKEEVRQGKMIANELESKSVLMIVASQNFRDEEFAEPKSILEKAGVRVAVASSSTAEAVGMLGKVRVRADLTLGEVDATGYDAVIFVGGTGSDEYWDDPIAHTIARTAYENEKLVCAICIAPVTLANAGLLKGKRATAFPSVGANLRIAGCQYTAKPVERDGTLITADGPGSAGEFGRAICDALAGR